MNLLKSFKTIGLALLFAAVPNSASASLLIADLSPIMFKSSIAATVASLPSRRGNIETTQFCGIKVNFTLSGINSSNYFRERQFFSPDRGAVFDGSQEIDRDVGMSATLNISGQF